eukprot:CAMPEP_0114530766 /NCGR_PEP_ID=MMETSP0109-20121206/25646_1 /TAXON_ID=29199 /ORGANISM="Chlorarachnion reptans, Strain CCCM449" /LENGTH=212 /DNA_ID=CAMNT_0001713463 /DNA_START=187 /DNA_END=821 /DNA_ORIENTATION=+
MEGYRKALEFSDAFGVILLSASHFPIKPPELVYSVLKESKGSMFVYKNQDSRTIRHRRRRKDAYRSKQFFLHPHKAETWNFLKQRDVEMLLRHYDSEGGAELSDKIVSGSSDIKEFQGSKCAEENYPLYALRTQGARDIADSTVPIFAGEYSCCAHPVEWVNMSLDTFCSKLKASDSLFARKATIRTTIDGTDLESFLIDELLQNRSSRQPG